MEIPVDHEKCKNHTPVKNTHYIIPQYATYLHAQVQQCISALSFQLWCSPPFVEEPLPHLPMRHWVCVAATEKRFLASIHHILQLDGSSQSGLIHSLVHQGSVPAYASQKHWPAHCKELQCPVYL